MKVSPDPQACRSLRPLNVHSRLASPTTLTTPSLSLPSHAGIAIFALQFTYYLWVKSVKSGSVFWAAMAALSYFYMVSAWGGYVFIINLIPLHVFVLLLMNRYSHRLFTSYTTFYILGLLFSMQIPFVGFQPIRTSEHMAASGVFALLLVVGFLKHLQTVLSKQEFKKLFIVGGAIAAGVVFSAVVLLTMAGVSIARIDRIRRSRFSYLLIQ